MEIILNFFTDTLNTVAWMYILLPCVIVGGLFFTIRNRAIQITKFGHVMKNTIGKIFKKQSAEKRARKLLQPPLPPYSENNLLLYLSQSL